MSKFGITPIGGVPAGPFNSSWSFSEFRDVVGTAIVGRSYEGLKEDLVADARCNSCIDQVGYNQITVAICPSTVPLEAESWKRFNVG